MPAELMEEQEILPATRSPHGYLVSPLSDNISMTDEGYLVITGCPIARTGWQQYTVADLPKERAAQLGVDVSNPSATIDLYRPASEVFAPEFLASLNGKPVVDNHPPGGEFVNPDNFNKYAQGHIQNVRKGPEPLEDGEWPVVADLIISGEPLISKVRDKQARDVSLGYDFSIRREGQKIIQCDMLGNHAAVVPKGRAGDFVSIVDAAPPEPAASPPARSAGHVASANHSATSTNKEKHKVKNNILHLLGLGLKARAQDSETDPEELAQAAMDIGKHQADISARDRKVRDNDPDDEDEDEDAGLEIANDRKRKAKDKGRRSRDEDPAIEAEPDYDHKPANDRRSAMHKALDRMLDSEEEPVIDRKRAKDRRATDADIEELKQLLSEFFSEEAEEPEHQDAEDEAPEPDSDELDAVLSGEAADADDEPCPDCGEVGDACACDDAAEPGQEVVESGEEELEPVDEEVQSQDRARAKDGATAVLRMMRPFVARSNDSALKGAFNAALGSVSRSSKASTGGYGAFAASSRARDRAPRNSGRASTGDSNIGTGADPVAKMQAFYDNAFKGGN